MSGLTGKKVGIAASRKPDVIATMVENYNGRPSIFSIQGEQILNNKISEQDTIELIQQPYDLVLLTTGIGAETLEKAAKDKNFLPEFLQKIRDTPLAVRGSKTLNWLKKHALQPSFVAAGGTMENLLATIAAKADGNNQRLFLQAYDRDDAAIKTNLEKLGYTVYLSKPYHYRKPDIAILNSLREAIIQQTLDVVTFTSKSQVKNLFHGTHNKGNIVSAFNEHVLAVAVGSVTAASLKQEGITRVFNPTLPKMGAMVIELERYLTGVCGNLK